ncbi:MAG: vanadium-dependent haloperoxidase [Cyanophyceae cyanobacterium]
MSADRKQQSLDVRIAAANLAFNRPHPPHIANGDEQKFREDFPRESGEKECRNVDPGNKPNYLASYTKGLPHDKETGLICNPDDFQQFVKAIDSGTEDDFKAIPLGPKGNGKGKGWRSDKACNARTEEEQKEAEEEAKKAGKKLSLKPAEVRAWESQSAGNTFDLEGPDAQAVTMPPAPALGSAELTAEMAEVYVQALLRDAPFTAIVDEDWTVNLGKARSAIKVSVGEMIGELNKLPWFSGCPLTNLSPAEQSRQRGKFTGKTVFRGITPGDNVGPYISQFLLAGNTGINPKDRERCARDGLITYGAINIDQKVRVAKPVDYMTTWDEWLDVQQGADLRGLEEYEEGSAGRRFITTPRDLATYVHYDALYEAYLNACLLMLSAEIPFDPGLPFGRGDSIDRQQGFAQFGGPHILSLVTEVATRALKAVRFQKFNVHRRLRPEALAARLARAEKLKVQELNDMFMSRKGEPQLLSTILSWVAKKNGKTKELGNKNYLLPMAFCEGSPMHPSYGAGHATVAGACVTILKAFFDHAHPLTIAGDDKTAFVPTEDGIMLEREPVDNGSLTVEGELNKLASNISIGRDWAGVHYFSDYIESIRLGEQIAISILEEQKLTYSENFSMTVPLFDGGTIRI